MTEPALCWRNFLELCGPVLYISPGKCYNLEISKERKIRNNQKEGGDFKTLRGNLI